MEIACVEIHVGILPKIYFSICMGKERLCSGRRGGVGRYFHAHPIYGPLRSPCSSLGALYQTVNIGIQLHMTLRVVHVHICIKAYITDLSVFASEPSLMNFTQK